MVQMQNTMVSSTQPEIAVHQHEKILLRFLLLLSVIFWTVVTVITFGTIWLLVLVSGLVSTVFCVPI